MAARDLSKTFEELESDDMSLEVSVPTDLTLSPDRSEGEDRHDRKAKITKQLIERKQIMHDMQLLRIELSSKNFTIENMKAESIQQIEELEEKLHDALHQKQILTARLESQMCIQQEEAKRRQELIKNELTDVRDRQRQLEATNEKLQERAGNVRRSLRDLEMTEDRYYELRGLSEDELSLRDFVALRMFEALRPLETEVEQLRITNKTSEQEMKSTSRNALELQEKLDEERQTHGDLRVKYQKAMMDLTETKSHVTHDNYKVENYDVVKYERDNLEHDRLDVQRQLSVLEGTYHTVQKERDDLQREVTAARQSLSLLKQDKEYLTKGVSELTNRTTFAEEKVLQANMHLEDAKRAREEMYEKYVASRDQYKTEYEDKLKEELEQIRVKTNGEVDRLRVGTREMYERENRNLREARDMAISEKDRAQSGERETNTKYESLLAEYRQLQSNGDNKSSELLNELKLKIFETERVQMVHEETVKNLKETQLEVEKLQKKVEVLTKEYYSLQSSLERQITEKEAHLSEKNIRLESYEKLEKELDDVILTAADVDNEEEAEKVLFSYGYGANVPTNAKRRMQQSVHLARRVLLLEKTNTSLRQEVDREKKKTVQLAEEVKNNNSLLDQAQQPYNYLIDTVKGRDTQVRKQREYIASLEEDAKRHENEKSSLVKTKNQMSLDLERLLNQREEMSVMKQVVLSLSTRKHGEKTTQSRDLIKPKSVSVHAHSSFETHGDPNIHKPGGLSLTNEGPQWFKQLKQKNLSEKNKYSQAYATSKT